MGYPHRSPCHYYDVKKNSSAFTSQKMRTHVTMVFAWSDITVCAFTFENQVFFNKTYELNFSLHTEIVSLRAYRRKNFALLANFFRWQFYSCKVLRP